MNRMSCAALVLLVPVTLIAQEPGQPPGLPPQEIPTLPETVVVPDSFPAQPLTGDVAVTPSRTLTDLGNVGVSISVVDERGIAESGQNSVQEVLRSVPGVDFAQSGGPGRASSVFIRGTNSNHTKVLLDGIPINDPSGAGRAFDFSSFLIDGVERIEVLRGPQSMLYGSDAIGGVINIITRRGTGPPELILNTQAGSFGTFQQSATVSGGDSQVYYTLGGTYLDMDGFSAVRAGREKDGYRNRTGFARLGWTPTEAIGFDFVARGSDAEAEIDGFDFATNSLVDDLFRDNITETFYARGEGRLALFDALEQRFGISFASYDRFDDRGFVRRFQGDTIKLDWINNLTLVDAPCHRNVVTLGADYVDEDASNSLAAQQSLFGRAVYVEDQIEIFDRWYTTVGGRWDHYSQAGEAKTYRATSLYKLSNQLQIRGSIGTGFRAPSIAELFGVGGNRDLQPEQSKGFEYGVDHSFFERDLVLGATYFRNDIDNLIVFVFDPTSPTFGRLENVQRSVTTGVELTASVVLDCVTNLTLSYTRTDSRNRDTDTDLARRPRNKFSLLLNRSLLQGRANVNLALRWVDDRLDIGAVTLDEYSVTNLAFWYDVSEQLRIFARVDNVFDEFYEELSGFGVPTASAYGGVQWRFR